MRSGGEERSGIALYSKRVFFRRAFPFSSAGTARGFA
jgi:hypothetical protein